MPANAKPVERFITFLRWTNVCLVFFSLLAYMAPHVSPAVFWPLSFSGLVFPFLLLFNLLFILTWLVLKKRYFIFSLLTILAGWGYILTFIGFGTNSKGVVKEGSIKITSFNAHSIVPKKSKNTERDKAYGAFADLIINESSHIYCFQETPHLKKAIKKIKNLKGGEIDPAYQVIQQNGNLGIMTNLPIVQTHSEYHQYHSNGYQWADLKLNDHQIIRVFNLHLYSNGITLMTEDVASNGNLKDEKTWRSIKSILGQYKRAAIQRAKQSEEIARLVKESPYPVVICGDFNDVPISYSYRILSKELQDTFKEKGGGFATTYTGPIPGLRIDYIFVSPGFKINSFHTGKRNFSDHKPVSTIIIPRL